jgi:Concanavalin A-like lectin/glucanases superfamily
LPGYSFSYYALEIELTDHKLADDPAEYLTDTLRLAVLRALVLASGIGVALLASCSLFTDLDGLQDGGDGGDAGSNLDASIGSDVAAGTDSGGEVDSGTDAASCGCTNLVSAYRFSNANNLGLDFFGANSMTAIHGTPTQSTTTPNGLPGHSIELDGTSTVCIDSGFTFDSTADHTVCWWSQPAALANGTNQFAQQCGYDTWTTNSGADYLWHINNCNDGGAADLQVPNAYQIGTWVQICQTYSAKSLTRTVMLNGDLTRKYTVTDTVPILEDPAANWCIGSYGSGGYWTGLMYLPMWFDRVLSDAEMQQVNANACCLP